MLKPKKKNTFRNSVKFNFAGIFFVYALIITTGLNKLFDNFFIEKIRNWKTSQIALLHLFLTFSPVDKIYKINKNFSELFSYLFHENTKKYPLKDDVYELQKNISDNLGQRLKQKLLKYYFDNNFLDLNLTFIDGHIIAYFGKQTFQRLKHSTRNSIIKSLELFNFSDKNGRIFYFKADHDVEGMQKNIELMLNEVGKLIGFDKIKILAFDRGGFSKHLFQKLKSKVKFITLAIKNPTIEKQISEIKNKHNFKKIKSQENKYYSPALLEIGGETYRSILVLNKEKNIISPFITNISVKELSDMEILNFYSMHWRQEQEHNATKKIGSNAHPKVLQDVDYIDNSRIKRKNVYKNKITKLNNEIISLNQKNKRLLGKTIFLESKIRPKSKQTDNKLIREDLKEIKNEIKCLTEKIKDKESNLKLITKKLANIPDSPTKKKYKFGPVDYSISMTNLASNLNSKLVEIATKGQKKFQLSTLKSIWYNLCAEIYENNKYINVNFINIKQKNNINHIQNLCNYFNSKNVKLHEKNLKFFIKN